FQDTNRLQADILAYLLEPLGQADFPSEGPAFKVLKTAPRRLIIFGDPKQSIYRFRGAEVDVFQNMKRSLKPVNLKTNFRSQKRIIDFFNEFFLKIMPVSSVSDEHSYGYAATYGPEDWQDWFRDDLVSGPAVEVLNFEPGNNMEENRKSEAEALAVRIKNILSGEAGVLVSDEPRLPKPGDLTILLRRFNHLKTYEQALSRAKIPYYTVRGRGFYECQEIWDLISLLFYLAYPLDGAALLAVLRSPLAGISDETLTQLAFPPDGSSRRDLASYFGPQARDWPEGLAEGQLEALKRIKGVLNALVERAGSMFPAELIEEAVEKTDYLAVLLAQYQGEQKVANVQRFIEITRHLPVEDLYTPRELARFLKTRLEDQGTDPEAQLNQEGVEAVQIMTIHQAKGLQFPVVFVPDAGHRPRYSNQPLVFGPNTFSLTFRDPLTDEKLQPSDYLRLRDGENAREGAEYLRLLYVAATRAQDYLVFSGNFQGKKDDVSWLAKLTDFAKERSDLVKIVQGSGLTEQEESVSKKLDDVLSNLPEPGSKARSILKRITKREKVLPGLISINATDMGHYLSCPRRYYLERIMGLPGQSVSFDPESYSTDLHPRHKGNILHRLFETVNLDLIPDLNELTSLARQEANRENVRPKDEELEALACQVLDFLQSSWGQDLVRARDGGLVRREMPFFMRIEPEGFETPRMTLTGEVDLFYVTPEGQARLVDYKYSHHPEPERYWPQLQIYALALKKAGLTRTLEAGLYFTNESSPQMVEMAFPQGWDTAFEPLLEKAVIEMAQFMIPDPHEPEPLFECQDLECGFKYACL
ncbi:MAG: PD-(D/E)XK nuclease family protein, partial [Deltaproteobacteria bacterium]|nr:PD-(D/E)XK nuclease family protein [Deltaproteobacteria bacterium]